MDLEKRITEKFKNGKNSNKKDPFFKYRGSIEEKCIPQITVTNLNDFMTQNKEMIQNLVISGIEKGKEQYVKELVCYIENNEIILEGVMDKTEQLYFINNIGFKITGIELIRIRTDDIEIDKIVVKIDNNTMFCMIDNNFKCILFETGDEYISTLEEAKDKKIIQQFLDKKTILGKNKRIRFILDTNKLMIK